MKDRRKPWMKELKTFRFARCGTMTQETAREQRSANVCDEKLNNAPVGYNGYSIRQRQYTEWKTTGEWKHSSAY